MMRKITSFILAILSVMALSACGSGQSGAAMYVEPAQLTEQEKNITKLLSNDDGSKIFDFCLDENAQSIHVTTYELIDGKWKAGQSASDYVAADAKGRIALTFDRIGQGLRVAIQNETGNSSAISGVPSNPPAEEKEDTGCATSFLSERTEATYDKEIPLVVQIETSKGEISSYAVDYFYTPEEYAKHDYDHIYAITVQFSQEPAPQSADASE